MNTTAFAQLMAAYNKDQPYEFKSKMYNKTRTIRSYVLAVHLFTMTVVTCLLVLGGCKKSGLSLDDLPRYPNAIEKESMEQSSPLGIVSAGLVQFTTSDTHDQVLSFYQTALGNYNTQIMSHELPDGRQTAIEISEKHGAVTVAIQEYPKEGKVVITFMRVGR